MQKLTANLGITLLAIWLILTGLVSLINLEFAYLPEVMSILALLAGVLILLRR